MPNTENLPRRDRAIVVGILLMMAAMSLFAGLDAIGKYLGRTYDIVEITWARYFFHFLFVLALVPKHGVGFATRARRPWIQAARASLLLVISLLSFFTLKFLPLAEMTAINATAPLLVTALSYVVLKERVGLRRWIAVAIGMVGVLVIIRPGLNTIDHAAFLALIVSVCYAAYQIMTRWVSGFDSPETTIFYTGLVGAVVSSALVPWVWTPPTPEAWLLLMAVGLLGGGGHYLLIQALKRAPASVAAPFSYSQILWATGLGFVIFGDLPDGWTIVGALLIVGAGLYAWQTQAVFARDV